MSVCSRDRRGNAEGAAMPAMFAAPVYAIHDAPFIGHGTDSELSLAKKTAI